MSGRIQDNTYRNDINMFNWRNWDKDIKQIYLRNNFKMNFYCFRIKKIIKKPIYLRNNFKMNFYFFRIKKIIRKHVLFVLIVFVSFILK
jgi:thioredoxin-related protein